MTSDVDSASWYKEAVFYEIRIWSFFDSVGDGVGDLPGLTRKLDYLQDLGVTALWLLPFYVSPMRDDGYDIANYTAIDPRCGTLRDFRRFVREAHRRGLKVVTELVLNHTSDQHPWFKESRKPHRRNRYRDFYIWSDTIDRYQQARIIFKDFETSNWAWDPVARRYYFHRFFAHQPDLNFDNPAVRRAILGVVDFWLRLGVDGLRLDAVPYLFKKEGTNCENLPETHAFLSELRKHVDSRFQDRMLLAEANQWPEDAIAYFGSGDECHMAFHFPVMPRLFSAIQMEDRFPIVDILSQTPAIPDGCQWALFLRNHDELTLEMVTDEERDYLYRAYARDTQMRVNLGIRRRLAPLLGNDRRKIELMNALLFSLPGTPVLYYGDEIGMGDNYYLGDRNGVRTPMQWNADRNAGFSRANPHKLLLPVGIDPEYHYETVNVEAQQDNDQSLLWWMKRLIALRKRHSCFGRGTIDLLSPANSRVLAFVRSHADDSVLVAANLSRFAQHVELPLDRHKGMVPVEAFGRTEFPIIRQGTFPLSLPPHAFFWFKLERPRCELETAPPTIEVVGEWTVLLDPGQRVRLEEALLAHVKRRPWFLGRSHEPRSGKIVDVIPIGSTRESARLVFVQVEFARGLPETFLVPLAFRSTESTVPTSTHPESLVVAQVKLVLSTGSESGRLIDAVEDPAFCRTVLDAIRLRRSFSRERSVVRGGLEEATSASSTDWTDLDGLRVTVVEQSNTSVRYGDRFALKMLRRIDDGVHPALELGRFLSDAGTGRLTPRVLGHLEYRKGRSPGTSLGILEERVSTEGTAWDHTLNALGRYLDRALTFHGDSRREPDIPPGHLLETAAGELAPVARDTVGAFLDESSRLGHLTAELHEALTRPTDDPAFVPEPFTKLYQRAQYQSMRNQVGETLRVLRDRVGGLPPGEQEEARRLLASEHALYSVFEPLRRIEIQSQRTRYHGNLALDQILFTGKDFVILDLKGDPARRWSDQRIKRSPLRDVASMLRSFHYAVHCTLIGSGASTLARPADLLSLVPWGRLWYHWVGAAFLRAYLSHRHRLAFLPEPSGLRILLDAFCMERALQELADEVVRRPGLATIPLRGIREIGGATLAGA